MKISRFIFFIIKSSLSPVQKKYQNNFIPIFLFALLFTAGCKQEYRPPAIDQDLGILVVDGFLNNSADTTFLRLTRTAKLQDGISNKGEQNASIAINDENGNPLYFFQQLDDKGTYFLPGMNLSAGIKYRLSINTSNGKLYQTDEIEPKATPPIDSVSWERNNNGVQIFTNTPDPSGHTDSSRWESAETWEYWANFYSYLKYRIFISLGLSLLVGVLDGLLRGVGIGSKLYTVQLVDHDVGKHVEAGEGLGTYRGR